MHISFIHALVVIWLVFSLTMMIIGMRIAATPVKPYKPRHIREAEQIAARCWKATEQKAQVQE